MSDVPLIQIRDLHANAGDTPILKGIDLEIRAGEVHAVMGPNGSGKSTLSSVLVGKPGYEVTKGEILYRGRDLTEMDPEIRARAGVFLAFQYPVEIPGVANNYFLRTAVNAVREYRGLDELDAMPMHLCPVCLSKLHEAVGFDPATRYRTLAEGYEQLGLTEEGEWATRRAAFITAP